MYLQIFPPSHSLLGHDGLYRIRHWVFAIWLILPNLSGALAFINPRPAFMAQGGFCSLPLRPIWYRLALFWIPRYLIWIFVVFVAVRIYRYVGNEFKVFGQAKDSSTSLRVPGESSVEKSMSAYGEMQEKQAPGQASGSDANPADQDAGFCAPDDVSGVSKIKPKKIFPPESTLTVPPDAERRQSLPAWAAGVGVTGADGSTTVTISTSTPNSRRGSRQMPNGIIAEDFAPRSNFEVLWASGLHRQHCLHAVIRCRILRRISCPPTYP